MWRSHTWYDVRQVLGERICNHVALTDKDRLYFSQGYGVRPRETYTFGDQLDAAPGRKSKIRDGSAIGTRVTDGTAVADFRFRFWCGVQLVPEIRPFCGPRRSASTSHRSMIAVSSRGSLRDRRIANPLGDHRGYTSRSFSSLAGR